MNTTPANDTAIRTPKHAGRDVWKAIDTIRSAIAAGTYSRATNAARYAFPRLGIKLPVPTSDDRATWEAVVRVMVATASGFDAEAVEAQASY